MKSFTLGMLSMESLTIAVIFLRYWTISRDKLFVYFAAAFACMALSWILLTMTPEVEARRYVYLPRLFAFCLLIAGIVGKNRRAGASGGA